MTLWLLERIGKSRYDEYVGHVIRAGSEDEARAIAAEKPGDEGAAVWTEPAHSTCTPVAEAGETGIILSDFHAG